MGRRIPRIAASDPENHEVSGGIVVMVLDLLTPEFHLMCRRLPCSQVDYSVRSVKNVFANGRLGSIYVKVVINLLNY